MAANFVANLTGHVNALHGTAQAILSSSQEGK